MAITYPLTMPASPGPRSFTPGAETSVGTTRSPWTFSEQHQLNQGQRWTFRLDFPPTTDATARDWWAFLLGLNGTYGTFYAGDPLWIAPRGTWAGSPVVNTGGQSGQTLAMRGFTAGATVKAGDYFQHGSGSSSRLYAVVQDATADGSGEAQLEIWPRIRIAPQDGDALVTASPKGIFRLASPSIARSWEPFRHGFGFDIVEAVE